MLTRQLHEPREKERDRVPTMTIPLWHPEAQQRSADGVVRLTVWPRSLAPGAVLR